MGLGFLFLGFMFLFDFETALSHTDSAEVYMLIDIFPDVIGWVLILVGLFLYAKKHAEFSSLKIFALPMLAVAVFTLLAGTLWYPVFYVNGVGNAFLSYFSIAVHAAELVFSFLLFSKLQPICEKEKEPKLASSCRLMRIFVCTEGLLYALSLVLRLALRGAMAAVLVQRLDYLFWVLAIWYGAILLLRSDLKLSD